MSGRTHVVTYDGGTQTAEISARKDISAFLNPLRHFNGKDQWALGLAPIPAGTTYGEMLQAGELSTEYIQAAGLPDAMTVEIRKPGGYEWGATWVRYTIGRPHSGTEPFDVPIRLAHSVKLISRSQVFDADEAAELFFAYYKTGDIPVGYELQPIEGYRADGTIITLNAS
ncbi:MULTISPECIES: hypothetical protein [Mycolicibacterium]|uniref:Uncharacterized protein n=2 Tax=Mycolicibacterium TaxID=1866885 RepID=W9AYU9_MYCCO|nr:MULTISPECIES: hypothetical protein [Mycolicibacterium]OKH71832.1 hypothetical protein EB74_24520 [Mycobacterium sp. SWH-M5]MBU8826963.1 hypothetical protein [Mycolicibacterium goodii]MBU8841404.1 hypothetical protein [Mycolicibacterium goodii]TLH71748.1 hypothetical protein C1S82_18395 [Mycolicibacterium cosmeticum]CDO08067.1 hypothetical protein BN977_02886 [Mycolicibacterium cosmeticum]